LAANFVVDHCLNKNVTNRPNAQLALMQHPWFHNDRKQIEYELFFNRDLAKNAVSILRNDLTINVSLI
jgi:hypothetical protein